MHYWNFEGWGKSFTNKHSLKRHKVTHDPDKKYSWDVCNKKFSLPQYLKEHKVVHTSERPYSWKFPGCNKSFRQAGKLSIHRKEHQNTKNEISKELVHSGDSNNFKRQDLVNTNSWVDPNLSDPWITPYIIKNSYWWWDLQSILNSYWTQAQTLLNNSIMQNTMYSTPSLNEQALAMNLLASQGFPAGF